MVTAARRRANKRWRKRNKKRNRIISYRSSAKLFLSSYANLSDLTMMQKIINKRKRELKK